MTRFELFELKQSAPVSSEAPVPPRLSIWARIPKSLRWALLLIFAIIANQIHLWWTSPERRMYDFARAVERGDAVAMLTLAARKETTRLEITPQKLRAMLRDAARSPGGIVLRRPTPIALNRRQYRYNRWIEFDLRSPAGEPLLSENGSAARVAIQAYNTDDGWRIGLSSFLFALVRRRSMPGEGGYRKRYVALCAAHGVAPERFETEDATWKNLSQGRR